MQDSMYHIFLRTSALTLALVLLFQSGVVNPLTNILTDNAGRYVATTIGMTAAVEPNEYNVFTAELTKLQTDLDAREKAVAEREIAVGLKESGSPDLTTFILSGILFILLTLIILNYVLDYIRSRRPQTYERPA